MTTRNSKSDFFTIDLERKVFKRSEKVLFTFLHEIGAIFMDNSSGFITVKHRDSSVIEALRRVQDKRRKSKGADTQPHTKPNNCEETANVVSGG